MKHAQFEIMGSTECFGGSADQHDRIARMVEVSMANGFGFTVHYVRVESAQWNLGRISQHWCDICPR